MGLVHPGVPRRLALWLRDRLGAQVFVETGTNLASTITWAAQNFDRAITVEADKGLYDRARVRLAPFANVELLFGSSDQQLVPIVAGLSGPGVMWLDAHWSGEGTAGIEMECPLLQEIDAVDAGAFQHVVLIDDARLFVNPPRQPHKQEHWPAIGDVVAKLHARFPDAYVMIFDDVIVRVPATLQAPLERFVAREYEPGHSLRRWLRQLRPPTAA